MIQCAEAPPSDLVAKGIRKGTVFFLGGEFTLSFDPSFLRGHRAEYEVFVDLVKKLRQKRFDDRRNSWNIPLADDSIKCLTQLVNWGVTPTKEAREKLSIELKAAAEQKAAAQAVTEKDVEISIPTAPALEKALKNYQKIGVNFMVKAERAYNADDMGLGKSLQTLAAVEKAQAYPALIVCPVKLKQNWLIECRKWLPHRKASMRANDMAEITVLSYTEIHKYVNYHLAASKADARKQATMDTRQYFYPSIMKVNAVVCDEAHQVKTATAMRTQACKAVVDVCDSRFRYLLSGTPIENAPHELIAPLNFLGLMQRMGGWHTFVHRYCGVTRKTVIVKGQRRTAMDIRGASNTKELNARMSGLFYIRRRKRDVLLELPDKIESIQEAEIDNLTEYRRIESDVRAFMVESRGQLMTEGQLKAQAMMKLNLLRQAAGVGKVAWLIEWVDTFLEGGEKFVLYAHHKEVLAGLVRGLKHHNPALLLAGCDDVTREVNKFATDKTCRLTIASITSAGFGVNGLQGAASHIGIAEPMWTHSKHQQAIDRLHRIGQKDCVNAYYFLAPGTIDDDLWQVVSDKARIVAAAADGEELSQTSVLTNLMRKFAKR